MYTIQIWVHCPSRLSEVLPEEVESTALSVEALVSQVLLELFGMVIVEHVLVRHIPTEHDEQEQFPQHA